MDKPDPEKAIDSTADDCADVYLFVYIMNMNKSLKVYTRGRQAQKKIVCPCRTSFKMFHFGVSQEDPRQESEMRTRPSCWLPSLRYEEQLEGWSLAL